MNQYLYFITNPGNEIFLKEEILLKYNRALTFSFSKAGLCTFKNNGDSFDLAAINKREFIFSRGHGIAHGIVKKEQLLDQCQAVMALYKLPLYACEIQRDPILHEDEIIFNDLLSKLSTANQVDARAYLIVIKVGAEQYFVGVQLKDKFKSPPGRIYYEHSKVNAPSRAYHKLKEAFLVKNISKNNLICAEFGCAPGGSTQFLLEHHHQVLGIDPAKMDQAIMDNKLFQFLNKPMQELHRHELPEHLDILISDVNLNPKIVLGNFKHLFKQKPPRLALITLKTPTPEILKEAPRWEELLYEIGYQKVDFIQLTGHRKECLAIAEI
jgi:23S rRNA (cytidine2498-2'-O)-methyltransferase